jgi:hypothetical protein
VFPPVFGAAFGLQVVGWLLTASTALFGAPFWFDLMQRVVRMRGTGARPEELPASRADSRVVATASASGTTVPRS